MHLSLQLSLQVLSGSLVRLRLSLRLSLRAQLDSLFRFLNPVPTPGRVVPQAAPFDEILSCHRRVAVLHDLRMGLRMGPAREEWLAQDRCERAPWESAQALA